MLNPNREAIAGMFSDCWRETEAPNFTLHPRRPNRIIFGCPSTPVRWHYRDRGLLWLFVPAYVVHVAEEWFGGFPQWIGTIVGQPLPATAFFVVNGIALVLAIVGIRAAIGSDRYGWIAVAIATIVLVNTLAHAAGAALTGTYSPGLISAVVLYIPLGSLAMIRAVDQAPRQQLTLGFAAGLVLHAIVFIVAFTVATRS